MCNVVWLRNLCLRVSFFILTIIEEVMPSNQYLEDKGAHKFPSSKMVFNWVIKVQTCLLRFHCVAGQPLLHWKVLPLYEFKLDQNVAEANKNICCIKDESAVDHSTIIKWFKTFCLGSNNFTRSVRPKIVDYVATLWVIEANLASSTQRVSGELSISQLNVLRHFQGIGKSICRIVPRVTKLLQN